MSRHPKPSPPRPTHSVPAHPRPTPKGRVPDSFYAEAIRLIREVKAIRRL